MTTSNVIQNNAREIRKLNHKTTALLWITSTILALLIINIAGSAVNLLITVLTNLY